MELEAHPPNHQHHADQFFVFFLKIRHHQFSFYVQLIDSSMHGYINQSHMNGNAKEDLYGGDAALMTDMNRSI